MSPSARADGGTGTENPYGIERPTASPPTAFTRRVRSTPLPSAPHDEAPITEADIAALPAAVRSYLHFMGAVGRPRVWSFRAHLAGRFRRGPDQAWMPCEAWQYNTAPQVARMFWMRIRMAGILPMTGWDTYLAGIGRMHGKLLGLVTVADGNGPEFDISELATYLNDAVLLAPTMLLRPEVSWVEVDRASFEVSLTDGGHRVRARVLLDTEGAPVDFSTTDRFADLPSGLVQARWSTPVEDWQTVDGRAVPTAASAVWHLPDGPFRYGEFAVDPASVAFNVNPAD
jgi:hypothetical protein